MPDSSLLLICRFEYLPSFRFCPPLKNDGRSELRFSVGLNTCLSFLNEGNNCYDCNVIQRNRRRVKNLAKDTGIKYSDLCTHARPYHLTGSVLATAFGGKLTLRKKEIRVLIKSGGGGG